jgi:hypothetical protein
MTSPDWCVDAGKKMTYRFGASQEKLKLFRDQFGNSWFKFDGEMFIHTEENLTAVRDELTRRSKGLNPRSLSIINPSGVRNDDPLKK